MSPTRLRSKGVPTLKVMKISLFPTGIRTVCPSSTPESKQGENGQVPGLTLLLWTIINQLSRRQEGLPEASEQQHFITFYLAFLVRGAVGILLLLDILSCPEPRAKTGL